MHKLACFLARREALDKSQRTDGESTATGSSTPSANSSSSLSSVGHETSVNTDHLTVCPTVASTTSDNNNSPSDLSHGIQSVHSPDYNQQPLALTTNGRTNDNKSLTINTNYRKETFPINHMKQHLISTTNNNNTAPYLKL